MRLQGRAWRSAKSVNGGRVPGNGSHEGGVRRLGIENRGQERADQGENVCRAVQISGATTKVCRAAGQGRDFSGDLRGVEPGDRQQAAARTGEAENQPNAEEDGEEALNSGPNRGCAYIAAKTV